MKALRLTPPLLRSTTETGPVGARPRPPHTATARTTPTDGPAHRHRTTATERLRKGQKEWHHTPRRAAVVVVNRLFGFKCCWFFCCFFPLISAAWAKACARACRCGFIMGLCVWFPLIWHVTEMFLWSGGKGAGLHYPCFSTLYHY